MNRMIILVIRVVLPVMVVVASVFLAKWMMKNKPEPERRPPHRTSIAAEVIALELQDYQIEIESHGTIQAGTETVLVSEVSGRIVEVSPGAEVGSAFRAGEVLLKIDPRDYESRVVLAESELVQAQAALQQEEIRVENYDTEVIMSQASVAVARLALEEERARGAQARMDWERLNSGSVADDLVLRIPQIEAADASVRAAEAELVRKERERTLGDPQVAAARAVVRAAEARVNDARLALERTVIKAPYAGRVLERNSDLGQFVGAGTELARIFATDHAEVRLPLTNRQLGYIELPEANVAVLSEPEVVPIPVILQVEYGMEQYTRSGSIVRTESAFDRQTGQLYAIAKIENPFRSTNGEQPSLRLGQFVQARITGRVLRDVFVIPRSVVREDSELWIVDNLSKLRRRVVEPIWADRDTVVVRKNLQVGELVCISPIASAVDGMDVETDLVTEDRHSDSSNEPAKKHAKPGVGNPGAPAIGDE